MFAGKSQLKREAIHFHYPKFAWHQQNRLGGAIRQGDYKLIERYDDGSVELYNLGDHLSEKNDLAAKMPDRARAMQQALHTWRKENDAWMPVPREP